MMVEPKGAVLMGDAASDVFREWAILELMGHRRLAGLLSEQTIGGTVFIRLDVPAVEGKPAATQFYSAQAVYAITPCSENTARQVAAIGKVEPVTQWELPRLDPPTADFIEPPDADEDLPF
jgi:hypothetical protein